MQKSALTALAEEHLVRARTSSSGRSATTVYGGTGHTLRHTLIALADGRSLDEHDSPGEATLLVLRGRVRLRSGAAETEGTAGDLLVVPDARHSLQADEDSAVLLTVLAATAGH